MKKKILVFTALLALTFCAVLSGCKKNALGAFGKTSRGLYLYADMAIQDVQIDEFNEKELDAAEYKGLLEKEIADYNAEHPFTPDDTKNHGKKEPDFSAPITLVNCEVSGNVLNQQLIYATAADYVSFNEGTLEELGGTLVKTGKLSSVDTEVLRTSFVDVDGKPVDVNALCMGSDAAKYRYIVADFESVIYGDGNIIAFANGMKYSKANSCVTTGSAALSIVIYK